MARADALWWEAVLQALIRRLTWNRSERSRVLWIVLVAALPLLALASASLWQGVTDVQARVAEEREGLARAAALTVDAFTEGSLATARALALTQEVRSGNPAAIEPLLQHVIAANPDWEDVAAYQADGRRLAGAALAVPALDARQRATLQRALTTDQPTIGEGGISPRTGNPSVLLAVPVEFASGERGVLEVSLSVARLSDELRALHAGRQAGITVVDSDGTALVHPASAPGGPLPNLRGRPEVDAVLSGASGTRVVRAPDGEEMLVAYATVPELRWGVLIYEPTSRAFALARRQLVQAGALLGIAALLTIAIGLRLGGRLGELYQRALEAKAEAEGTARDLASVSAESERRRRFLERLVEDAPAAIAVLEGPEHVVVTANPRFQSLKPGVPMVGRPLRDVFPEFVEQGLLEVADNVLRTGERFTRADAPIRVEEAPGQQTTRYLTLVIACYDGLDRGPQGVLLVAVETTEMVDARLRAERERDAFLASVGHELKTPLASLHLAAQLLQRVAGREVVDREQVERHAAAITREARRASALIEDLLDLSRLEAGQFRLRWGRVDLSSLIEAAVSHARQLAAETTRHAFEAHLDGSEIIVEGDGARLEQVLTNLLANAAKYSPPDRPIEVRLARSGDTAEFRVVDHGPGIPPDERTALFEPFSRTRTARESNVEGTGLGLYIARRIMQAHGGSLVFEETPGGGATFVATLPLRRDAVAEPPGEVAAAHARA